jgi:SET domain-containing protein
VNSSATVGPSSGFASKYKVRIAIADSELLNVQRSKIHNYGLFAKNGFGKGEFVVEYQGEILRETIADEREKRAERAGNGDGGSCYMFRLDEDHVIDATLKGNCARFINHSCNPNCTCRMVEDENRKKHIMIIAKRDIAAGEEITYDYQFAVESEKLACLCGAPNCLGRLN